VGAKLGATGMNELLRFRTNMNNEKKRARGHGLSWTGPDPAQESKGQKAAADGYGLN
jgi:hypothetical protein